MTPYYADDFVTIYHGDCREWMPEADVIITDPPYGLVGKLPRYQSPDKLGGGRSGGWAKTRDEEVLRYEWDDVAPQNVVDRLVATGLPLCIWGGNYFVLPPSRGWLIWNKPERGFSLSEAEMAWTNRDALVRVFDDQSWPTAPDTEADSSDAVVYRTHAGRHHSRPLHGQRHNPPSRQRPRSQGYWNRDRGTVLRDGRCSTVSGSARTHRMTRIPIDPNGWSVNPNTGTIHTRYADHGNGLRTRTEKGVLHLLDGKAGKVCATCYGKTPRYPQPPRPPQRRRVSTNGTGPSE